MANQLTIRQERFIENYIKLGNGTQAAIIAGYSKRSASSIAEETLRNPEIQSALESARKKYRERMGISVDRVLKERARMAFYDPRKLLDNLGRPLPLQDLDDDTAAAIQAIDVQDLYENMNGEREQVGTVTKIKLADKDKSLTAIEKHLGMYQESAQVSAVLAIHIHLGNS